MNDGNFPTGDMPYVPPETAPQWFLDNLKNPGESRYATVDGHRVHFLAWNLEDESLPVLVFVHGFGGHARWWSFLVPFFTDRYRVVAIDLPGMGDSDNLPEYHDECFARGILGVIGEYGLAPVTIVGHSYGGVQSMYAMTLAPELFRHGIIIDCNLWFPQKKPKGIDLEVKPHKRRPSRQACVERFSLMPRQPEALDFLMEYVAYHGCTADDEGWYWKHDYMLRTANLITDPNLLTRIPVKVDCIFGEKSVYNKPDLEETVEKVFPNLGRLIIVPDAYHHLAMDHPLELVQAIEELLEPERPADQPSSR